MSLHLERVQAKIAMQDITEALARLTVNMAVVRAQFRDAHMTKAEHDAWWSAREWADEKGLL